MALVDEGVLTAVGALPDSLLVVAGSSNVGDWSTDGACVDKGR